MCLTSNLCPWYLAGTKIYYLLQYHVMPWYYGKLCYTDELQRRYMVFCSIKYTTSSLWNKHMSWDGFFCLRTILVCPKSCLNLGVCGKPINFFHPCSFQEFSNQSSLINLDTLPSNVLMFIIDNWNIGSPFGCP